MAEMTKAIIAGLTVLFLLAADSALGQATNSSRLEFLSISKAREKARIIHEFYNLRGQRLSHYGIKHADGIVLERVMEPTGKVSVKKKYAPNP